MELEEILQALKNLTDEQKAKVREALEAAPPEGTPEAEGEASAEETPETADGSKAPEEGAGEQIEAAGKPAEAKEEEPDASDAAGDETSGGDGEGETEPAAQADEADEPIPAMTKEGQAGVQAPPVDEIPPDSQPPAVEQEEPPIAQAPSLTDEQGEELPVDYQQIIDGLNAKNLALEAENKQLKAKVEGAFGLTGKPGGFAKVNPLYDDTSDIPPMRKR